MAAETARLLIGSDARFGESFAGEDLTRLKQEMN
jgi:hypothetical protein